ncbi:hypothetical protein B0H19DRAFT_1065914 [Mycena capillaripes]|nr:hypothetical protein B0H19DRAFT_1065914 [Mycena capillaripes]
MYLALASSTPPSGAGVHNSVYFKYMNTHGANLAAGADAKAAGAGAKAAAGLEGAFAWRRLRRGKGRRRGSAGSHYMGAGGGGGHKSSGNRVGGGVRIGQGQAEAAEQDKSGGTAGTAGLRKNNGQRQRGAPLGWSHRTTIALGWVRASARCSHRAAVERGAVGVDSDWGAVQYLAHLCGCSESGGLLRVGSLPPYLVDYNALKEVHHCETNDYAAKFESPPCTSTSSPHREKMMLKCPLYLGEDDPMEAATSGYTAVATEAYWRGEQRRMEGQQTIAVQHVGGDWARKRQKRRWMEASG